MESYVRISASRDCYDIRDVDAITIRELIDDLENFPMDAKVVISFDRGYTFGKISYDNLYYTEVETREEEEERIRKEEGEWEEELEKETILVCPYCGSEDIEYLDTKGYIICNNCDEKFNRAREVKNK